MPYRVDISDPPGDALDRLVQLGALDVESLATGLAALLPDAVPPERVARELGVPCVAASAAVPYDDGSVWLLSRPEIRVGRIHITAPDAGAPADAVQLAISAAFGTGYHPTTVLCLEALDELHAAEPVDRLLDVGTGSGILALAALRLGVRHAVGLDVDVAAVETALQNARLNGLSGRFEVVAAGPEAVEGQWPLVVANVLAAPLMEMAPVLVRRIASRGRLILCGIQTSLANEVLNPYHNLGMRSLERRHRAGWTALILRASW